MREPTNVDYALRNWINLNDYIGSMTIDELRAARDQELAGKRRKMFVLRLANKIISFERKAAIRELKRIEPKTRQATRKPRRSVGSDAARSLGITL
jgi:hypothetical protein